MSSVDTIVTRWRTGLSYAEIIRAMKNSDLTQVLVHAAELRGMETNDDHPMSDNQLDEVITLTEAEILQRIEQSDGVYKIFDTMNDVRYAQPIFQCATAAEVDEWMENVHPGFREQYVVYAPGEAPQPQHTPRV